MKKQVQLTGERKWWGSDWIEIQGELWKVIESIIADFGQACIISGCKVSSGTITGKYNISSGIIMLKDNDGNYQYAEFGGATNVSLNGYLVINTTTTNILYEDGNSKAKRITNSASFSTSAPAPGADYVLMTSTGGITWREVVGMLMTVTSGATLSTGHAVKFDKDRSEMFTSVDNGAIQITFDFTNAVPGSVTRMRFAFGSSNTLTVDEPVGSDVYQDDGELGLAPSHTNVMYFLYAGRNEYGRHEVSYVIKQVD